MQFTIRSLFLVILAFAIFLGMAQTAGYVVAAGILLALLVLRWAISWRRHGPFLWIRHAAGTLALTAIWFLAVDWSWFVMHCPDCNHRTDTGQYRVLGIPIHTYTRHCQDTAELILEDLAVPCEHTHCEHWHKYRYWGLVIVAFPRNNDLHLYDASDQYTGVFVAKVRQLGADDPQLAAELHDLIVQKHDHTTFWKKVEDSTGFLPF